MMNRLRLFVLAIVCAVCGLNLPAQTATNSAAASSDAGSAASVQRDAQAIAILQAALGQLGGLGIANPSVVATGEVQFASPSRPSGSFIWKRGGREFRYDNPDGTSLVSGSGKPARAAGGKWKRAQGHQLLADFPSHLPGIVMARALADTRYEIRSLGTRELNGHSFTVVSIARIYGDDSDGFFAALTRRTFYFEAITNLPVHVEYEIPDDMYVGTRIPIALDYQAFAALGGLNVPTRFTLSVRGELFATYTIKTVDQTAISAQEFAGEAQ